MPGTLSALISQHRFSDDERLELADASVFTVYKLLASTPNGLTESDAADRLRQFGENQQFSVDDGSFSARLWTAVRSPFVALLSGLGVIFVVVGDARGAVTVAVMVALAVGLRVWQQTRSVHATRALRELVTSTVTVRRRAAPDEPALDREVSTTDLVPGDVLVIRAGDVVPADVRLVAATDLVVDQSVLSGESLPVPKSPAAGRRMGCPAGAVVEARSLCFSGTAVVSGSGTGVVIAVGENTFCGSVARAAMHRRPESSVDRGVRTVGWTLIRFMLVMVPIVLVVNGTVGGDWTQAAMFAVAVAVGLTPEMLPVIVTTNLARGAMQLARERVIVRRLDAIQDLGAMDVLCVDKTGTLTEDRVVYAHSVDPTGRIDDGVAEFAYLAVHFQDGPHNRLDDAIVEFLADAGMPALAEAAFGKVDEIGFDYTRRRTTVVVRRQAGEDIIISKGDPDEILALCSHARIDGDVVPFGDDLRAEVADTVDVFAGRGQRVLAIAARDRPVQLQHYDTRDERELVLIGFVGFVDPVRSSAASAVASLRDHGVAVKILTGDGKSVATQVAAAAGISADTIVLGNRIDALSETDLRSLVQRTTVFAKLTPANKSRIVAALRDTGHAVGFLGDGVNDAPALRAADVGIAADTATDVAKAVADVILLDKDLAVLAAGVVEGRRTLGNTMKYVKITASSNFGNVLSVVVASVFLPFLPILPIQLMVQNLLYDTAQLALPWDRVDEDYLQAPRRWHPNGMIRFMLTFGPLSSLFDLATFAVLWWGFDAHEHPELFQTGWFVEGLLTQLLVVLVLRAREVPWRGARVSRPMVLAASAAAAVGVLLALTPFSARLAMSPLPIGYVVWLVICLAGYALAAQFVKKRYLRHNAASL